MLKAMLWDAGVSGINRSWCGVQKVNSAVASAVLVSSENISLKKM